MRDFHLYDLSIGSYRNRENMNNAIEDPSIKRHEFKIVSDSLLKVRNWARKHAAEFGFTEGQFDDCNNYVCKDNQERFRIYDIAEVSSIDRVLLR